MKSIIKHSIYFFASILVLGCSKDDDLPDQGSDTGSTSALTTLKLEESFSIPENSEAKQVKVLFNKAAPVSGEVQLKLSLQEGLSIQTIPEAVEKIITLPINKNDQSVFFTLIPIDNNIINGDMKISVTFHSLSEGFRKSTIEGITITIKDDELKGMPKKYISNGYSEEFFYGPNGTIKEIAYESTLAGGGQGSLLYTYSEDGKIQRKEDNSYGMYTDYYWDSDRVIRAETYYNDFKASYILFEYDDSGQISRGITYQYDQATGNYIKNEMQEFTYYEDGNLHQALWYVWSNTENVFINYYKVSYEEYLDKLNPFSLNEVIPGLRVQKNLYSTVRWRYGVGEPEEVSKITYIFDSEGRPIESNSKNNTATFEYY